MRKTGNFDKLYLYHTKPDNTKTCPPMDIRQLTIFVEAARARNFRAAALQLGIAQPAVTQRIRQLEENLGFKLFHRINRGVELTPAGQSMLIEAEEILARTKGALEKAQQIRRGQLGTLRIGYGTSVMAERKLPALITRYGDEHPDVTLELLPGMTMEQLIEQVATRKTDVAFIRAPLPSLPQTLRAIPFDRSKLCVALPERHALANRSRISVGDIVREKLLLPVDEIGLGLSSSALSLSRMPAARRKSACVSPTSIRSSRSWRRVRAFPSCRKPPCVPQGALPACHWRARMRGPIVCWSSGAAPSPCMSKPS